MSENDKPKKEIKKRLQRKTRVAAKIQARQPAKT